VHSDIGLAELFTKMARESHVRVDSITPDELVDRLLRILRDHDAQRIAVADEGIIAQLSLLDALRAADLHARRWTDLTLDDLYDFDCGLTNVYAAVAETGSLVIRGSAAHGRSLSLVPPLHIAIVEPRDILPDVVDLVEELARDPGRGNTVLITGPSKTADIEMTLVKGVHGPRTVQVLLLCAGSQRSE
jgi:L-lactate dehydrogenase complex protein LldG